MQEPVLVVMAAGMGSRYGGLKQIDPVGRCGEKIIDFSLYDAKLAGFQKVMFIIKEELLPDFEEAVFAKARQYLQVDYVFQKLEDVPEGFSVPEGRIKPWGTGHAALTAAKKIDAPFAVINADDFYGREGFAKIYRFLKQAKDGDKLSFAMVGYYLKNTVTEHGFVSRGVCETNQGMLSHIVERTRIEKQPQGGIAYTEDDGQSWVPLPDETVVSMNLWGFTQGFTKALEADFTRFFQEAVPANPLKAEFFLPFVVNDLLAERKAEVEVLSSGDKWYGVTYQEDKQMVMEAVEQMTAAGRYPSPLWEY